jgi:hypothetical protein
MCTINVTTGKGKLVLYLRKKAKGTQNLCSEKTSHCALGFVVRMKIISKVECFYGISELILALAIVG